MMSFWSFYFLGKVGLYYAGYLGFHWLLNLLLAVAVLWPVASPGVRRARLALALPLAVALLYYDSHLPPIARVLSQTHALAAFSPAYMMELLGRVFSWRVVAGIAVALMAYVLLSRRIRFGTFALLGIVSVPLLPALMAQAPPFPWTPPRQSMVVAAPASGAPTAAAPMHPDERMQAFYTGENQRRPSPEPSAPQAPFDLIVLHVCSLSWDDMEFVGLREHSLMARFDAVFTQFNTAASYSGPAALRLLRGNCGQGSHHSLYEGADPSCYFFPTLEQLGWRTRGLLNHDGKFDGFGQALESRGGLAGKFDSPEGAPIHMRGFDGSPIYADRDVLSRWWQARQQQGSQPVALYYNTVSLHDGNQVPGSKSRSSLDTYKPRLAQLLADFDRFLTELEATGRPVVVLLLPEHGAALRGDRFQISGMREIPNPRITLVPAALKVIGGGRKSSTGTVVVDKPVSYLDLNGLLASLMRDSPFSEAATPLSERVQQLKGTDFVAENDDVVMLRSSVNQYLMRNGKGAWLPYEP